VRKVYYPALVDKDADSDFGVSFPDFPGCVSAGETLEDALLGAQEALSGPCRAHGRRWRRITETHFPRKGCGGKGTVDGRGHARPCRAAGASAAGNVTLDEALLEEIDQISDNRSGFLAEAARAELARRRA